MDARAILASCCRRCFKETVHYRGSKGVYVNVPRQALYFCNIQSEDESGAGVVIQCALKRGDGRLLTTSFTTELVEHLCDLNHWPDVALPGVITLHGEHCLSLKACTFMGRFARTGLDDQVLDVRLEALQRVVVASLDHFRYLARHGRLPDGW